MEWEKIRGEPGAVGMARYVLHWITLYGVHERLCHQYPKYTLGAPYMVSLGLLMPWIPTLWGPYTAMSLGTKLSTP